MEIREAISLHDERISDIELEPWEREVVGMYRGIRIVDRKAAGEAFGGFNGEDILAIHRAVLNDPFNRHLSGELRRAIVGISVVVRGELRKASFRPVHPDKLPDLFQEFSGELHDKTVDLSQDTSVSQVLDIAAWAHQKVIEMHPFIDGNGRTARLLVDLIFKKKGLPYITDWGAKDDEYKDIVDKSFRNNDINLFKVLLARKLLKSIRDLEKEGLGEEVAELKSEITVYQDTL